MVRRTLQHCCSLPVPKTPAKNYIWISDDELKFQWQTFARGRSLHTHRARPSLATTQSHATKCTQIHGSVGHADIPYETRRHGSNAPGPLEARRRRTIRKQMTGASNLGIFGIGLDFSSSPWRYSPGSSTKSIIKHVRKRETPAYEALKMIWEWVKLDTDTQSVAVTEKKAQALALAQAQAIPRTDPFQDLLASLGVQWDETPEDIVLLLENLLTVTRSNRQDLLSKTCVWLGTETHLGTIPEPTLKTLLWNLSRDAWLSRHNLIHKDTDWGRILCESIGEGIVSSRVREAKDLHRDTIWFLVRSFAANRCCDQHSTALLADILFSLAHIDGKADVDMLSSMLAEMHAKTLLTKDYLRLLEESLPEQVFAGGVLGLYQSVIKACKNVTVTKTRNCVSMRLLDLLRNVTNDQVLQTYQGHKQYKLEWLQVERDLQGLGMPFIVAYLRSAKPQLVCKFVLNHAINSHAQSKLRGRQKLVMAKIHDEWDRVPMEEQTFANLAAFIQDLAPHAWKRVVQFLFRFFHGTHRMQDCYSFSQSLSKHRKQQLSHEDMDQEARAWAEDYPVFALLLLSLDPRPWMMHHPIVARILGQNSAQLGELPPELLLQIARAIVQTHGINLRKAELQAKTSSDMSITILQLLLQPLAHSDVTEAKAFKLAHKILAMLEPHDAKLRKETSTAITNIVAIKTLDDDRKITPWKMDWLGEIVTFLEGPDEWHKTRTAIEARWLEIKNKMPKA